MRLLAFIAIWLFNVYLCFGDVTNNWILVPRKGGQPIPSSRAKTFEDSLAKFVPQGQLKAVSAGSETFSWIVTATQQQIDSIKSAGIVSRIEAQSIDPANH